MEPLLTDETIKDMAEKYATEICATYRMLAVDYFKDGGSRIRNLYEPELAKLRTQLDKLRWIPLSERRPESGKQVQIWFENGQTCFARSRKHSRTLAWIDCEMHSVLINLPTHWREILGPGEV